MSSFPPVGLEPSGKPAASSAPRADAGPRALRVLLVEDNPDDGLLLHRHLARSGFAPDLHRVETAGDMLAALAEPALPWDCILADYNLPLFSAPEALKLLQAAGQDIPFIMMSGAVNDATAVAAMRAGAHDYVSKENLTRLGPAIERELAEAASRRGKRATERALQSSQERFHRLVEATPLALLISDMRGRVSYSNRGAQRLLGFEPADQEAGRVSLARIFPAEHGAAEHGAAEPGAAELSPVELSPVELSPVEHSGNATAGASQNDGASRDAEASQCAAEALHGKLASHGGETWESTCLYSDGTTIPVLLGAAALNPEAPHNDLQLAIFFVDLTQQKQAEEVLRRTEKLAATGRLAASIAHEINNPLEAITNCLYLLEQSALPADARGFLRMAQGELDRVSQITTQTLRFYRQSTRPVSTDIPELIESVLALYEARIRGNAIQVVRNFYEAPPIVALDGEIRQVLANIIGNAVDALIGGVAPGTGAGDPQPRRLWLRVRACRSWHTGSQEVSILIADSGSGMSPATLSRIFEAFFSTKGITGTGLGLWVSREIIGKHNGRVQVRTRQRAPSGTVFRIVFPLQSLSASQPYEEGLPTLQ